MLAPSRTRIPPVHTHSSAQRCMFTKPAAVAAVVVLTLLWLWLSSHPLLRSPMHVHALHIDVPAAEAAAETAQASDVHPFAAVLVDPAADSGAVHSWRAQLHHLHHQHALPSSAHDPSDAHAAPPPFSCYGVHAQRGRREYMEDTHASYLAHQLHYSSAAQEHLHSEHDAAPQGSEGARSAWSLFGVFDGHGGDKASDYAAAYLLPELHAALVQGGFTGSTALEALPTTPPSTAATAAAAFTNASAIFSSVFEEFDDEFIKLIARPQRRHDGSTALVAGIYHRTAANPLLGEPPFQLVVANLGDCRAILIQEAPQDSEAQVAAEAAAVPASFPAQVHVRPLSADHKPELPAERAWVESHPGGFVTSSRGERALPRVQGVLAVSRALGDAPLKPWVRNQPDVLIQPMEDMDAVLSEEVQGMDASEAMLSPVLSLAHRSSCESRLLSTRPLVAPLLLLASDGFWDVFSNEQAGQEVLDFLRAAALAPAPTAEDGPASPPLLSALAHHLVAQAYLLGSFDNITVMIIDIACVQRWSKQQRNTHAQ